MLMFLVAVGGIHLRDNFSDEDVKKSKEIIKQFEEAPKEIIRSQKKSRPHRKIIKKKYNAPEVKPAPQEKDKIENIISRRQVGPT
jgi:hypothetical protein